MRSTQHAQVPRIGVAAECIQSDVVYLQQVPRGAASSGLRIDAAAEPSVGLSDPTARACTRLYADTPMRGRRLMEDIAQVNRVFRDKAGSSSTTYPRSSIEAG